MAASFTCSTAARAMDGVLRGADVRVSGVCTDSRRLAPGQLFVALKGKNFDGHNFLLEARERGAAAVVVAHAVELDLPQIVVADTRLALGRLAAAWRARFNFPVVAVTGSNGKTTVKELTAAILRQRGRVLATQGNLNNEIGVPLTLLSLSGDESAAVIEEGASHAGDIAYLTQFVRPTVAVVTNASGAHLAGFGSVAVVARTKGEIYEHLAPRGTAVINADDASAGLWRQLAGQHPVISFGLEQAADVRGQWAPGRPLQMTTPAGPLSVQLQLEGRHNAMNALAATAAALAAGIGLPAIKAGLESVQAVPGRLQWKAGWAGARILDDTYNANPASLKAALEVLAACPGERYLALGDMAELGDEAVVSHEQAGRQARACGVARLYAVGELTRHAVRAFGEPGRHFAAQEQLIASLKTELHENVVLLVKGSRSARMENVVNALVAGGVC